MMSIRVYWHNYCVKYSRLFDPKYLIKEVTEMRFSPTKFLHGLLCTAPILVLTLAACGGGGGGDSTPAPTYSLGGAASGVTVTGASVVLQNNGGDNKTISADGSYTFATKLAAGASYNITVLTNPASYVCSVANATGTMTSAGVANANVTCLPSFTVGGSVSGLSGSGLVLRNNGGDDKSIVSNGSYTFATEVADGANYNVTVLSQPNTQNQLCTVANATGTISGGSVNNANVSCSLAYTIGGISGTGGVIGLAGNLILQNNAGDNLAVAGNGATDFTFSTSLLDGAPYSVSILKGPYAQDCVLDSSASGNVASADVTNVLIACSNNAATIPALDKYAYTANYDDNTITNFDINAGDGSLNSNVGVNTGLNKPTKIAVKTVGASNYAYVTNYSSGATGYISVYKVNAGNLDVVQSSIATGKGPFSIAIHPTGYYAYAVNYNDNTVSGYSIDATTGALTRIDTDGTTAATQYSISTGTSSGPNAIAIHPGGGYVYVVNNRSSNIRGYSIDAHTGALASILTIGTGLGTGSAPYSITIDPTGRYAYVANAADNSISAYSINASDGMLNQINADNGGNLNLTVGNAPKAVTIHPSGKFAYVLNSNSVMAYKINAGGGLSAIGTALSPGANNLISISIDNSGKYAYVTHFNVNNNVFTFSIDPTTGALTQVGSAVSAGSDPYSITTSP